MHRADRDPRRGSTSSAPDTSGEPVSSARTCPRTRSRAAARPAARTAVPTVPTGGPPRRRGRGPERIRPRRATVRAARTARPAPTAPADTAAAHCSSVSTPSTDSSAPNCSHSVRIALTTARRVGGDTSSFAQLGREVRSSRRVRRRRPPVRTDPEAFAAHRGHRLQQGLVRHVRVRRTDVDRHFHGSRPASRTASRSAASRPRSPVSRRRHSRAVAAWSLPAGRCTDRQRRQPPVEFGVAAGLCQDVTRLRDGRVSPAPRPLRSSGSRPAGRRSGQYPSRKARSVTGPARARPGAIHEVFTQHSGVVAPVRTAGRASADGGRRGSRRPWARCSGPAARSTDGDHRRTVSEQRLVRRDSHTRARDLPVARVPAQLPCQLGRTWAMACAGTASPRPARR